MASSPSNRYLLNSEDMIHLGVYYLLKFASKAPYNKWMFVNEELVEIIQNNDDKNTLTVLNEHYEIKNIKIKRSKHKAVELKKQNEQQIIKIINKIDPDDWNFTIAFFFGANFHTLDQINWSTPTIDKITKLTERDITNLDISEHAETLTKCIKNNLTANKPIQLSNNPISRGDWKQIEDALCNNNFDDALHILKMNENKGDYYKDIYIVYALMQQYEHSKDIEGKKQTFKQMIKHLAELTIIMEPSDYSLFADILLNYNPNPRESDKEFIENLVIASCLCMFEEELNVFNLLSSLTAYKLLMDDNGIITDQHLENNDKIQRICIKNVKKLFDAFDTNTHIHTESKYHNQQIDKLKSLWNAKLSSLNLESKIESISLEQNNDENINLFECSICGKAFSSRHAVAGHRGYCLKKHKINKESNKKHKIKATVKETTFSQQTNVKMEDAFSKIKYSDLSKEEQMDFLARHKRKKDPNKIGVIYKCLSCGHMSDHKGNMVQHQNRMHAIKKKMAKVIKKKKETTTDEIYKPNVTTRKRKRQQSVVTVVKNDGLNEPRNKKQKMAKFECVDCGFEAKNGAGLSAHQRKKKHGKYDACNQPMIVLGKYGKSYRQREGKRKKSDKEENDDESVSMDDDDSLKILD